MGAMNQLGRNKIAEGERGHPANVSRDVTTASSHQFFAVEPFVDADAVAEFLSVKRKTVLDWARAGAVPAHPFGRGKRVVWRFRISEIAGRSKSVQSTMEAGSPELARQERQ
jgi:hypothetical protein